MVNEEELAYIEQLEQELQEENTRSRELKKAQTSLFGMPADENLIKWQLDLREDLDRIYHLLRGDEIKEDDRGNTIFVPQNDVDLIPFNDFGVQIIMNVISFYINRNTILSNYDTETIYWKVYDFSIELTNLIFNRYEEMMMTTNFSKEFERLFPRYKIAENTTSKHFCFVDKNYNGEVDEDERIMLMSEDMIEAVNYRLNEHLIGKMKLYPMIVRAIVDSVHSAYLRAFGGGERTSLREARSVTQHDMLGKAANYPMVSQPKKRNVLNPVSWFKP